VGELRDGQVHTYEITPEEFGLQRATLDDISGGDAVRNAALVREVLSEEKSARRDVVLLNAAAALVAAGRVDHLRDAVPLAINAIDSGAALAKLKALVTFTSAPGNQH
jgi:anthranilate phosphoribosyltransferase